MQSMQNALLTRGVPCPELVDPCLQVYDFSPYAPRAGSMHTHNLGVRYGPMDEHRYYDDYSRSYFAVTRRKGGWDCMRHYEILAAGTHPDPPKLRLI